ncbi:CheY-like superfamily [Aspergillus pseudoustus]|uniref:CheY-like superfamily n=1 Tax=Aspergillus pseudoustus TaxID=1810923 RepID=A0ABR4IDT7_9EURO
MHILFVDDNQVWQRIALVKLPQIGCTVAVAGDGQQALDYLAAPPEQCPRADLIMMDIAMPILDGLEATRILRTEAPFATDPKLSSTPIVGLCTTSLAADHRRFMAQGMDDIIVKPWKVEQVQQVVRWWAQRRVVPRVNGVQQRYAMQPGWGHPLGVYRGPRSRM